MTVIPSYLPRAWLASAHALLIQPGQPAASVIGALQPGIGGAVVGGPELVLGIERRRVQPLGTAEGGHLGLDQAVVVAVASSWRQGYRPPETEVHVDPAGL